MPKRQYNVYIDPQHADALNDLFEALGVSGQRESRFSPGIDWLGETADAAFAETVAALEIAAACAAGGDWYEMIQAIEPK